MSAERRRLTLALLLSLLIHTLLLSLISGGQGHGLPGFGFPWRERRIEAPELRIVLVPAQVTAAEPLVTSVEEPLRQASIGQPVVGGPALTPSVSPAPIWGGTSEAIAARGQGDGTGQADGRGQAMSQTPRRVRLLRGRLCPLKSPVTRQPHRSLCR